MAADAKPAPSPAPPTQNGTHTTTPAPIELALTLPSSPGTKIHIHLTILAATTLLFLTSASLDAGTTVAASMGSFVMGMPDRYNPSQPLSTALYSLPSSLDFTTRMAKLLARRTGMPCYVGGSIDLSAAAGGGSVEEEMAAFRAVVEVVTGEVGKVRGEGGGASS